MPKKFWTLLVILHVAAAATVYEKWFDHLEIDLTLSGPLWIVLAWTAGVSAILAFLVVAWEVIKEERAERRHKNAQVAFDSGFGFYIET